MHFRASDVSFSAHAFVIGGCHCVAAKNVLGLGFFFMLCLWSALKLRFVKENAILFALAWAGGLKLLGCAWRKWWAGAGLVSRLYGCDGLCHRL